MRVHSEFSTSRSLTAGILLLVAGIQYVTLEAVAAAGWHSYPYSYAVNFISDLGNPVPGDVFAGRPIDSPLHVAMDIAFIAQGALFIAGALILRRTLGRRLGIWLVALALLHGLGVILVGLFPESSGALTNGGILVHSIAAAAAIVVGNAITVVVASTGPRLGLPSWYRILSFAIGLLGLAGFVVLQVDRPLYDAAGGIPERIAVDAIVVWELVTAVSLILVARARRLGAGVAASRESALA